MTAESDVRTDDGEGEAAPLLEVEGLKKHFDTAEGVLDRLLGGAGTVKAVDGVDLTIREGETLAVVGESGCGKSTLGLTLLNLLEPSGGTVRYRGERISGLSDAEMRPYRRDLQMIFQDPLASLNPRQTVGEILKAPLEVHDVGEDDADRTERVEALLERVGLKPGHVDRYPRQFSGGQQQRVGIARAIAVEPELIVADEPTSALDVSVQAQILNLLEDLQDEFGLAMVFVTHDLSVVRHISDRVAVMYLGEFVEVAPTEALFGDPGHPYTRSLLSAIPRIDPEDRTERVLLEGTVPSPLDPPSGCRFHTRCPEVIPPEGWAASQEVFERAFTFRVRVLAGEVDSDAARTRLESENETVTDRAVADRIVESTLPGAVETLPGDAADAVHEAAFALATGSDAEASEVVREAFPSPCERDEPADTRVAADHIAACHRVDPAAPGDPVG